MSCKMLNIKTIENDYSHLTLSRSTRNWQIYLNEKLPEKMGNLFIDKMLLPDNINLENL
ncbi:MAG: hypothetical protein V3U40_05185 [Candidatus Scalindua sediminis]